MQEIKLLVLDLDETLVKPTAKGISAENREAVRRAMEKGVRVTLASGRQYMAMRRWAEDLGITEPVIAANGADVRQGGAVLFRDAMDDGDVAAILVLARQAGMMKFVFSGDHVYCMPEDANEELFEKWAGGSGGPPVVLCGNMEEMQAATRGNVQKVLLWAHNKDQHSEMLAAMGPFRRGNTVLSGEALNIEVNKKGTSKAAAVERVAREMGISMAEVMAVGDSENDVELLRAAGLGVAMGDAMAPAKEAADCITACCEENGVARAIERFLL